nr:lysine--tRNA ligase-like [Nerophis lumbriciformis]
MYEDVSYDELLLKAISVRTAGRVMLKRNMGKAGFITLLSENNLQVYLSTQDLGDKFNWLPIIDIGDIWGIEGILFRTKKGELTIRAINIQLLAKALRPFPDKYHGLQNQEMRYRQRYLDLIMNKDARAVFLLRSEILERIRQFMRSHDFLEVETPMLHPISGGAAARPFLTHHNTLDLPMYLRIAPELYLKRLIVGGFLRIFEINRNFRNEGMSVRHNPEFTMMEFYAAYQEYQWLMKFTENLLHDIVTSVHALAHFPTTVATLAKGPSWRQMFLQTHGAPKRTAGGRPVGARTGGGISAPSWWGRTGTGERTEGSSAAKAAKKKKK